MTDNPGQSVGRAQSWWDKPWHSRSMLDHTWAIISTTGSTAHLPRQYPTGGRLPPLIPI
ncbi:MAG TPA: hypothetical protein VKY15_02345 [Acidimicrobiales bacterium]|nr:hypothetical protein [Acidimicrobiales bacterium]